MTQAPIPAAEIELGKAEIDFIVQYGPRCRDCADRDGICSNGMPCGGTRKVAEYVIGALNYGWKHGFLAPPKGVRAEIEAGRAAAEVIDVLKARETPLVLEIQELKAAAERVSGLEAEVARLKADLKETAGIGLDFAGKLAAERIKSAEQPAAERVEVPTVDEIATDAKAVAQRLYPRVGGTWDLASIFVQGARYAARRYTTPPAAVAGEEGGR